MNRDSAKDACLQLWDSGDAATVEQLDPIWAALAPATTDEMLGLWAGVGLNIDHHIHQRLSSIRWYGKNFRSLSDVDPILCETEEGELIANATLSKGGASVWEVAFRGEVTATMVYDGQPILDHFKHVNEHMLLGIMNGTSSLVFDHGAPFYFLLHREQ